MRHFKQDVHISLIFISLLLYVVKSNPTTRILNDQSFFFFFWSFSVTLRVSPLYLGNQESYHKSAAVKTTENFSEINPKKNTKTVNKVKKNKKNPRKK